MISREAIEAGIDKIAKEPMSMEGKELGMQRVVVELLLDIRELLQPGVFVSDGGDAEIHVTEEIKS